MVALAAGRRVAFAELVDECRVVDQRAGHLHEFETGAEGPLDAFAADQPADVDQRTLQRCAELFGIFEEVALLEGELLDHQGSEPADEVSEPERRVVAHGVEGDQSAHDGHRGFRHESAGEDDPVDAERLDHAGDLDALGDLDAALESVVHVVLDGDGHAAGACGPDGLFETHPHEAHAVFERASVFVAPMVGVGREELRDEIAVPGMDLHGVESGVVGGADGASEVFGDLFDLAAAHAAHGGVGVEVHARRCADGHLPGGGPVCHVSAVSDLNGGGGSFAVDGVGDVAQPGDDRGAEPELLVERETAAADGGVGERGHADAAAGYGHVVLFELLRRSEILAHRLECRGADRAVAQRHGAELVGREEFGFHVIFGCFDVSPSVCLPSRGSVDKGYDPLPPKS